MIKPVSLAYSILVVVICFSSCKKSDLVDFHGTFHSSNFYVVDNPIMYTVNGTNTDTTVIRKILERCSTTQYFTLNQSTIAYINTPFSLNFSGDNNVDIQDSTHNIQAKITSKTKDNMIITQLDSIFYFPSSPGSRCEVLARQAPQITSPYSSGYYILPGPGGFTSISPKYQPSYPLLVDGTNLYVPYLSYMILSSSLGSYCTLAEGAFWNTFNKEMLTQLRTGDTVVIQVKRLQMVK